MNRLMMICFWNFSEWRHSSSHRRRPRTEEDGQEVALLRGLGLHPEPCMFFAVLLSLVLVGFNQHYLNTEQLFACSVHFLLKAVNCCC